MEQPNVTFNTCASSSTSILWWWVELGECFFFPQWNTGTVGYNPLLTRVHCRPQKFARFLCKISEHTPHGSITMLLTLIKMRTPIAVQSIWTIFWPLRRILVRWVIIPTECQSRVSAVYSHPSTGLCVLQLLVQYKQTSNNLPHLSSKSKHSRFPASSVRALKDTTRESCCLQETAQDTSAQSCWHLSRCSCTKDPWSAERASGRPWVCQWFPYLLSSKHFPTPLESTLSWSSALSHSC